MSNPPDRILQWLRIILVLIAAFHLIIGSGLMFSTRFQMWSVALYGAQISWDESTIYFLRIIGSFAFVLGFLATMASRDPLKHQIVVVGFIGFFVLRNISRYLYSDELYAGFNISPLANDITAAFFGLQALLLALLLWKLNRRDNE